MANTSFYTIDQTLYYGSLSAALDANFGSTQGDLLYRTSTQWTVLPPGASGQFLQTLGAGFNPQWSAVPVGGDLVSFNNGTFSTGPVSINVTAGTKQILTVGGAILVAFTGWTAGVYQEVEIELINGGSNITWPTVNWLKGDGTNSTTFSAMGVTLNSSGTNFIIVWSRDGGVTVWGRAA